MNTPLRVLTVLALAGGVVAGVVAVRDSAPAAAARTAAPAPVRDTGQVAGSGIVEASTGTIAVGTPVTGLVASMDVRWGERVPRGAPLFRIDARDLVNKRAGALAAIAQARATLPAAEQRFAAVSSPAMAEFVTRTDRTARASDLAAARANVVAAQAQLHELDAEIARRTVPAPITGRVLKINVRPGEVAEATSAAQPVLLLGGDDRLFVRVDIDQHDAPRLRPGAPAQASVPGDARLHAPLRFERIEPFVQPKTSLTGAAGERTDTRVLQVIYSVDPKALPVFIGQQLDVVIAPAARRGP